MKHVLLFAVLLSTSAFAGEKVVATLTTATGAPASTATPTTGTASWAQGGVVLLQCTTDTFVSWDTPAGSTTVTPATNAMQLIAFSSNSDPYIIYLGNNDKHISVLAATAAGTCKFILSPFRRKP
jgi:hypothetical protein